MQVLFLQGHSTCFGLKRPSSGVFKTSTAATGTCVMLQVSHHISLLGPDTVGFCPWCECWCMLALVAFVWCFIWLIPSKLTHSTRVHIRENLLKNFQRISQAWMESTDIIFPSQVTYQVQQLNRQHKQTVLRVSETNFTFRLQIVVAQILRSAFRNPGSLTLDRDKISTLFSLTYNINLDFHSITNTNKKVE